MNKNNENVNEKEPFLYVLKFRTAIYSFILFVLLSNKIAFNVLNVIISSLFNNRIEIFNDKNGNPVPVKEQKQYTPIGSYKPTGNLVYNNEFFEKIEKRLA